MGCGYCITLADPETDPDGFTWSKRYKVHKYLSTSRRTGQQQDQDQDIASKKISPSWLVAATAVVLVWFRPTNEYELACCVPRRANYSRNTTDVVQAKCDWKWSEGSLRRRERSLFSIIMLSLAMCVPRKRSPAYLKNMPLPVQELLLHSTTRSYVRGS